MPLKLAQSRCLPGDEMNIARLFRESSELNSVTCALPQLSLHLDAFVRKVGKAISIWADKGYIKGALTRPDDVPNA